MANDSLALARLVRRLFGGEAARPEGAGSPKRILIYGGSDTGVALLKEIRDGSAPLYEVKGFIDDDPRKKHMSLLAVPVLGCGADLPAVAQRYKINEVFIAVPSADGTQMTRILRYCHDANLPCKTVPVLGEFIDGAGLAKQIRDVEIEDLLGRTPIHLDQSAIGAKLLGEVILVTGAAGSIGSELCRQIARFRPRAIIGFDMAETPLLFLDQEMCHSFPDVAFFPEIGSIQNPKRLAEVFARYPVSVVYHAAAYKHVPLMENQIFEAIDNNVLGTWRVAAASADARVRDFVLISSEEAVRPANIIGLTKRVAEHLISALQNRGAKFVSVRFGNVLGSNGSVIPMFRKQIAAGGPIKVTHPEMQRYFMTLPETAQLILQASSMGRGGEVFVLDMGVPVKIVDLATNLILLSGLNPGQDIQIEYSGVRPGERMSDELDGVGEHIVPTHHERVKAFSDEPMEKQDMARRIQTISALCDARDSAGLLLQLEELVPEYNPSREVLANCLLKPELKIAMAGI